MSSILQNEKYKGDALLQKTFTVDFLSKKIKENEGEVPQYYVEGSHPAIIEPMEFDLVQSEFARRKALGGYYSGNSVFSSKLVCGDCGCFYGQKVWHSTDAYRKVIWQCNGKFKGQKKCTTPHLSIETIQRMFLRAYNQMMGDRERVIEDCDAIRTVLCDCEKLDGDIAKWHDEIEVIAGLVEKGVQDNASSPLPQGEYGKRYESLVKRYDKAVAKHESLIMERTRRLERDKALRLFTEALRTQPLVLDVWDERLWITLVDKGTVHPDGGIAYEFKDGTVIEVWFEI